MPIYAGLSEREQRERRLLGSEDNAPLGRYSDVQALAAAGTDETNAGLITVASDGLVTVSAADDTKGVKLPRPDADGYRVYVKSTVASKILKVYPHTGAAINSLTATTGALSFASGKLCATFIWDATAAAWFTFPLVPS